jgi:hypothetical protein
VESKPGIETARAMNAPLFGSSLSNKWGAWKGISERCLHKTGWECNEHLNPRSHLTDVMEFLWVKLMITIFKLTTPPHTHTSGHSTDKGHESQELHILTPVS